MEIKTSKKRTGYADGWHKRGDLEFYVEDGCLMRGVWNGTETVYPYRPCREGGYDNVSGIKASYYHMSKVCWF